MPILDGMLKALLAGKMHLDAGETVPVVVEPDGSATLASLAKRLGNVIGDVEIHDGTIVGSTGTVGLERLKGVEGIKTIRMQRIHQMF